MFLLTYLSCKTNSNLSLNQSVQRNVEELNIEINKSQLESIKPSPFQSSEFMTKELETQLLFRKKYINVINEIKKEYPENPIVFIESYQFSCSGCPAYYVSFFNNKILISYQLKTIQNEQIDKMTK